MWRGFEPITLVEWKLYSMTYQIMEFTSTNGMLLEKVLGLMVFYLGKQ